MAIVQRILAFIGDRQAARWDRFGGPGPVLRWCFGHPWLVTVAIAGVLAAVLAAVFGVPPFSPLVLVLVLVAPIAPVLRAQARLHERWTRDRPDASPGAEDPPGAPSDGPG